MALPVSTIALALATATTFGLAVRDTLTSDGSRKPHREYADYGRDEAPELDEDDLERMAAERESARRRYAAEEAAREVERRKRREKEVARAEVEEARDKVRDVTALAALFGEKRATFGGVLAGTRLGMPSADFAPKLEALNEVVEPLRAEVPTYDETGGALRWLEIHAGLGCNDLHDKVSEAWGGGARTGRRVAWQDDATSVRVVLDKISDKSCTFRFEPFAPLDRWLARSAAAVVPTALLNRSDADLLAELKRRPTAFAVQAVEDLITWTDLGPATGRFAATMVAVVAGHVVKSIEVTIDPAASSDAILDRLKALYGDYEDVDGIATWKKPYTITFDGQVLTFAVP
ncbi:MAG: hypothetical protein KF773_07695 [Deltaproteobacteria bacterium]|nr:hypothetical protein [Deltaproteobacteria bacterium]